MTTGETTATSRTAESLQQELLGFLSERIKTDVEADQDLFTSGVVSSMFAMQLVVHLESTYDIAIVGPDLKLDNFRTVVAMAELVLRLQDGDV
ncbi:acyl carrier protein [Amycolatopsis sp. BJA-103]|uniref:acyl carrier protein n=1 Tax=unclassified Amycolatopsis TaxID=2618356 RepID=UPI000C7618EE|nr:acyl carrier protein [Amycolatopsis sp. BJA-103]AUI58395.1 methoxymalonate biosynthesis protein [Amycolatopsis sp. BJA-103]PNE13403.1 methoxymalonate biosynthesis protein [Amycolatopsis sp. BJA-103]